MKDAFRRFPAFQAETLRRLADVEEELGNWVASAAYRIRLVRRLGIDPRGDLMAAAKLLVKAGLPEHARFVADLVLSGEYLATYEAKTAARRLLAECPPTEAREAKYTKILDSRQSAPYRVSYIFSLYNEERRIEAAVRAYARQTLYRQGRVELIFVDSNSPENESALFDRLVGEFPHLLYVKTERRETVYQAWNRGIELATGEYLGFSTPSDFLFDDALEQMAHELDQCPDVDWVQGDAGVPRSHPDTAPSGHRGERLLDCSTAFSPLAALLSPAFLTFTGSLFRRDALERTGKFDPLFRLAGDTEFKMRFVGYGKVAQLGKVLDFSVEDGTARLTDHPLVEIERFMADRLLTTPDHVRRAYSQGAKGSPRDPAEAMVCMLQHSLGFRPAWSGTRDLLYANVELAHRCAVNRAFQQPRDWRSWYDVAVVALWHVVMQSVDRMAMHHGNGAEESVSRKNRLILSKMITLATQLRSTVGALADHVPALYPHGEALW